MNACTTMPAATIPLHRPLWQKLAEQFVDAWQSMTRARSADHETLSLQDAFSLNDQTLRDIGVSDSVRELTAARRSMESLSARVSRHDFADHGRSWYG